MSIDVILIKIILKDVNIPYEVVSLLGDNRALITFASKKGLQFVLYRKVNVKDFFNDIVAWNSQIHCLKWLVWINAYGIPIQFWPLELFQSIKK